MLKKFLLPHVTGALFVCCAGTTAHAATISTSGAGSAVTSADRTATFDGIAPGDPLDTYEEDGLLVTAPGTHCCFSNVHYENGGNLEWVTIATNDGRDFFGLEFAIGTGFGGSIGQAHTVVWESYRDGLSVGSGLIENV